MKGTPSASSRSSTGWSPTKHVRCLQTPGRIICTRAKCQPLVAQKKNKNRGTDRLALFLSGVHFVCVCVVCRSPGRPEMRRGTRMMRSFRRRLALLLPRTAGSSRSDLLRNRTRSSRLGSRRTWRRCPCGATQNSTARGSVRLSRRPALLRCSSCPPVDFCLCLHVASTSSSSVIRTSNRAFKSVRIRQYSGADAYPYVSECGASVPLCAELPVCVLMCAQRVAIVSIASPGIEAANAKCRYYRIGIPRKIPIVSSAAARACADWRHCGPYPARIIMRIVHSKYDSRTDRVRIPDRMA
jgi:hypothetical protein